MTLTEALKRLQTTLIMNAVRLRYAYAITCHKAQGSEWKKVLIDPQYNYGNHQWLYTAVTRASEEVRSWFY